VACQFQHEVSVLQIWKICVDHRHWIEYSFASLQFGFCFVLQRSVFGHRGHPRQNLWSFFVLRGNSFNRGNLDEFYIRKWNLKVWLTTNMIFGTRNIWVIRRRNVIYLYNKKSHLDQLFHRQSFRIWCHSVNCKSVFLCFLYQKFT
jgi:hypothetical protein